MPRSRFAAFGAGILSGLLFLLASSEALQSSLFLIYTPLIPLFLIGFQYGPRISGFSGMVALLPILLTGYFQLLILYFLFTLLPAQIFINLALRRKVTESGDEWYPLTRIVMWLSLYACVMFLLVALHFSGAEGGLEGATQSLLQEAFKQMDPQYSELLDQFSPSWNFMLYVMAGSLWICMVYGMAMLANLILSGKRLSLRDKFNMHPSAFPLWFLLVLVGNAFLAILASGALAFTAKVLLVLLLLPYMAAGFGLMHASSREWKFRSLWLTMAYMAILLLIWPLIILALVAVLDQLKAQAR